MTHSTVNLERENVGSQEAYIHQINITSLDAAGQENYSPNTELGLPEDNNLGVRPVGQTDEDKIFSWNASGNHLNVKRVNGTITGSGFTSGLEDVPNNGDPGEVRLLVTGGGT